MSDTQLPPVGSLWLHRETGERRFVNSIIGWEYKPGTGRYDMIHVARTGPLPKDDPHGRWANFSTTIADWLAWQAGAERIDREEA